MERVYRGQIKTPPRAQFSAPVPPKLKLQRRTKPHALRTLGKRSSSGKRLFLLDTSVSSKSHPYSFCPHAAQAACSCNPSQLKSLTELERELFPNEPCLFEDEPAKVKLETSAASQAHRDYVAGASQSKEPELPEGFFAGGDEMNLRELCTIVSASSFSRSDGRDAA